MTTIKELKALIANMPDDMEIGTWIESCEDTVAIPTGDHRVVETENGKVFAICIDKRDGGYEVTDEELNGETE